MTARTHAEAWKEARRRLDVSVSTDLTLAQWAASYGPASQEWWSTRVKAAESDESARAELAWATGKTDPVDSDTLYLPEACERVLDVWATFAIDGTDRRVQVAPRSGEALGLSDPWNAPDATRPVYTEGGLTPTGRRRLVVYADQSPRQVVVRYLTGMPDVNVESDTPPPYPRLVQDQIQEITLRKLAAAVQDPFRYQAAAQVETQTLTP